MLAKRIRQIGYAVRHPIAHLAWRRIALRAADRGIAMPGGMLTWKYVGNYLDARIDTGARQKLIAGHYSWMLDSFPHSPFARKNGECTPVWQSVDKEGIGYAVTVGPSDICPLEGEIELLFRDDTGRLAFLTLLFVDGAHFGLASGPAILIGGIQGGYGRRDDYRRATKNNGEVTPMNILFIAAKALANAVGAKALLGMPDAGQVARVYASDSIYLNYDRTWTDFGGVYQDCGYFTLELEAQPARSLDHLSSAHRARARRKGALKARLQEEMQDSFRALLHP